MLMIRTEPVSPESKAYMVTLETSPDHIRRLSPSNARSYAEAVLRAAAEAQHDAQVFLQVKEMTDSTEEAASMIVHLRQQRPPYNDKATRPLKFLPGVSEEGKPFLTVTDTSTQEIQVNQMDVSNARQHALVVLEAVRFAELDTGYCRQLTNHVDIPIASAQGAVDDLPRFAWKAEGE